MTDHPLPAERRALLNYIEVLLQNPELDDKRILASLAQAVGSSNGLNPQPVISPESPQHKTLRKPRGKSPSDGLYVKGIVGKLKNFLYHEAEADWEKIGLSADEIRKELYDRGMSHTVTTAHIQRVLTANQRHWQKLPNGNWRPKPNGGNVFSGSSDRRLLESKKRSKPDTDEQHN